MKYKKKSNKEYPIYSGVLRYFPKALMEVSQASIAGNKQHVPGTPLHWDRSKSGDHLDACVRHLLKHSEGELIDDDGVLHLAKCIWRLSAELEIILDEYDK